MKTLRIYFRILKLRFAKRYLEKNRMFFDFQKRIKGRVPEKLKIRQAWYEYMFEKDCIEYDIQCMTGVQHENITTSN